MDKLHRAKLHTAKLHRAKLHRAKFYSKLHRAKFYSKLHRAKLHRAKLHRAKLHRAKLHRAKLHRAKLHRAKEPSYIEPSYIEPSYIEPSYIEPSYIEPSYIEPSYIEPSYIEPSYIEPSYIEPSYIEPSYIEPSYIEPSCIEPGCVETSYIEPSYEPGAGAGVGSSLGIATLCGDSDFLNYDTPYKPQDEGDENVESSRPPPQDVRTTPGATGLRTQALGALSEGNDTGQMFTVPAQTRPTMRFLPPVGAVVKIIHAGDLRGRGSNTEDFFTISAVRARPSAETRVVKVQKRFLARARDPLRRFAWSRFSGACATLIRVVEVQKLELFTISAGRARPSAEIRAVEVQKLGTFYDFCGACATLCGDLRGRGSKTEDFLALSLWRRANLSQSRRTLCGDCACRSALAVALCNILARETAFGSGFLKIAAFKYKRSTRSVLLQLRLENRNF